jgi:MFS-type transporter involved in bile tolerance (Atg22 family)
MMTVFSSAIGPLLLAETLQRTGSYDLMFYSLSLVVALLGIISWYVPLPVRRPELASIVSTTAGEVTP